MATQKQKLLTAWVDIKTSLSLTEGINYTLSNNEAHVIYVAEAVNEPDADFQGIPATKLRTVNIKPTAGNKIWARSEFVSTAYVTEV